MATKQQTQLDLTGSLIAKSVTSVTLSKRYTQKMVRCCILNIIYQRLELEESELKTRNFKGVPFIVLKNPKKPKHHLINLYISWLNGIEHAIENNYLKEIFLFMRNSAGDVSETYNFKLKYNRDPNTENKRTLVHVQKETTDLLQAIRDLGKNEKLENTRLTIEFTYHPVTPREYQPPGFSAAVQPECLKVPVGKRQLGSVNTGFHKITCRMHGALISDESSTHQPTDLSASRRSSKDKLDENEENVEKTVKTPASKINISEITLSVHVEQDSSMMSNDDSEAGALNNDINCLCELTITFAKVDIIRCIKCAKKYHAPCHGYKNKRMADVNFSCIRCGIATTTDRLLPKFDMKERPIIIKMRLIVYFLENDSELPEELMNSIDQSDKKIILDKLKFFDIYDAETKSFNKVNSGPLISMLFNNSQYLV
ncbi:uncharacterized protein [Leptinotarsa decemlineata]|uniref:uncharacterized protein n=1 Tax=Leptinotarsa decemlineata TaxID=7539 RepID=UPI003D30D41C